MTSEELLQHAKDVLAANDAGSHTIPAAGLYPHQWLWDSCFIAIGLRHYNIEKAQKEVLSLLRGQWSNGMIPHMIFDGTRDHRPDQHMWRSWVHPSAPDDVATTGITQPPVIAEALVRIGKKLPSAERRTWYQTVFPALVAYHQWMYRERDPHQEGLVLQIHPWETGLDNTPPWMKELHDHQMPLWITLANRKPFITIIEAFRRDTHYVKSGQRSSTVDQLALYSVQRRLRRKNYDIDRILSHSLFAIEDLTFNSILNRANHHLQSIARAIKCELPPELLDNMRKTSQALEQLWDAYTSQYYSRNFASHKLIKEPSIATLMPLYAGSVTKERAAQLVKLLQDKHAFGLPYPVPSVPLNSTYFKPQSYWQGPTWINTNWLIIDGLKRYGYDELANLLAEKSIQLVATHGSYEYFSPLDGSPAGSRDFSWTAALTIDLLSENMSSGSKKQELAQTVATDNKAVATGIATKQN